MKHELDLDQLSDHVVAADANDHERRTEASLRPQTLEDFVGQRDLVGHLRIVLGSARARNQCADHLLFAGPPGLGKTSLASIVASEMGAGFRVTSGPVLSRPGDLAALLTDLHDGDVLFIDELHRLSRTVEEVLYPAMEDLRLDVMIGRGPSARSIRLDLPNFTLVGATTRTGLIRFHWATRSLRSRGTHRNRVAIRKTPGRRLGPRCGYADCFSESRYATYRESIAPTSSGLRFGTRSQRRNRRRGA